MIVLTLATAAIHLSLVPAEFRQGATGYGTLFILTAVGYVIALAVLYAPVDIARPFRAFARFALIAIAAASIIAYVSLSYLDTLGWVGSRADLADPSTVGLRRDRVPDVGQRVQRFHRARLDAVMIRRWIAGQSSTGSPMSVSP